MKARGLRCQLKKSLSRAWRHSELRKLLLWLKGRSLHWVVYLAVASLVIGGTLRLHDYLRSFFFVVYLDEREVGLVRDTEEVAHFIDALVEQLSDFYGMIVEPVQEISLLREYRPGGEADANAVKKALRGQINVVTDAVVLTVNAVPVLPVASEEDIQTIINLLSQAYIRTADNIKLLEVSLLEEIACEPCRVPPESVRPADVVAALLLEGDTGRVAYQLASRGVTAQAGANTARGEGDITVPLIHVKTVEEVTAIEAIPFSTSYTYTSSLWYVQSRISVEGKNGRKQVVYHVTRTNGIETDRQKMSENTLDPSTTRVIERGTARVPSMGTGRFIWPVQGGSLTSGYGWRWDGFHYGIDIGAPTGTNVLAADSGVVVVSGWGSRAGNYIVLYHGDYWTLYLHHSVNLVSQGAVVQQGQAIARVGSTGYSFGPHLHFEIRRDNGSGRWTGSWHDHTALDPLSFFRP